MIIIQRPERPRRKSRLCPIENLEDKESEHLKSRLFVCDDRIDPSIFLLSSFPDPVQRKPKSVLFTKMVQSPLQQENPPPPPMTVMMMMTKMTMIWISKLILLN